MTHLPSLNARKLTKILKSLGFEEKRQRGSHLLLAHPDGRTTLVPKHGNESLGRGLLRQILRQVKLSPEEFTSFF